jgi:hypothetical protein
MPAEESTAGETWQRNLNCHAEGLNKVLYLHKHKMRESVCYISLIKIHNFSSSWNNFMLYCYWGSHNGSCELLMGCNAIEFDSKSLMLQRNIRLEALLWFPFASCQLFALVFSLTSEMEAMNSFKTMMRFTGPHSDMSWKIVILIVRAVP